MGTERTTLAAGDDPPSSLPSDDGPAAPVVFLIQGQGAARERRAAARVRRLPSKAAPLLTTTRSTFATRGGGGSGVDVDSACRALDSHDVRGQAESSGRPAADALGRHLRHRHHRHRHPSLRQWACSAAKSQPAASCSRAPCPWCGPRTNGARSSTLISRARTTRRRALRPSARVTLSHIAPALVTPLDDPTPHYV